MCIHSVSDNVISQWLVEQLCLNLVTPQRNIVLDRVNVGSEGLARITTETVG